MIPPAVPFYALLLFVGFLPWFAHEMGGVTRTALIAGALASALGTAAYAALFALLRRLAR